MNHPLLVPLSLLLLAYLTPFTSAFLVPVPVTTTLQVHESSSINHQHQKHISCLATTRSSFAFVTASTTNKNASKISKYSYRMSPTLSLSKENNDEMKEGDKDMNVSDNNNKDDDDGDFSNSNSENDSIQSVTSTEIQSKDSPVTNIEKEKESKNDIILRDVSFGAFKLFSYIIQFLGLYFAFGLVLNLLGFGYSFTFENGFQVDTIQNIRNERQFEQEMERIAKPNTSTTTTTTMMEQSTPTEVSELQDTISPPSSLPK